MSGASVIDPRYRGVCGGAFAPGQVHQSLERSCWKRVCDPRAIPFRRRTV